jgi:hypothetical protein
MARGAATAEPDAGTSRLSSIRRTPFVLETGDDRTRRGEEADD